MAKFENRESLELLNHGEKVFGIVHRPITIKKGKVPAVLMFHGFAGNKVGKYRIYVYLAQRLCRAGILTIRFDFRGCGDSEGDIMGMTLKGEVSDAKLMMDFLLNDPQVDPERIGIFGRSLGGVVAVKIAHAYPQVKSLGLWAPAFSGKQWHHLWELSQRPDLPPDQKRKLHRFDGSPCNEDFLREFFSLKIEKELRTLDALPLLHIHGEKDEDVYITHADEYLRCRTHSQGETRMIRLPNTDHEFTDFDERFYAIDETVNWFKYTL